MKWNRNMAWFNQVVGAGPRRNAVVRTNQNQLIAILEKDVNLARIECASMTDIVVKVAFVVIGLRRSTNVSEGHSFQVPGSFNNLVIVKPGSDLMNSFRTIFNLVSVK